MNRAKIIAFLKTYKFLGKNFNRDLTFVKRKKNKKRKKKNDSQNFQNFYSNHFSISFIEYAIYKRILRKTTEKKIIVKKKKEEKYFFSKFFFPIFFPKNFFTFIFVYKNYFSLKLKNIYIYISTNNNHANFLHDY